MLVFPNTRTAENRNILPLHAEFKDLNVSNIIDLTRSNTTITLPDTIRQILKSTHLILKQNKVNPAYTHSNV